MIPEALAAPMVVELWAQLLVVTDMRTGQYVTTSARISKRTDWPLETWMEHWVDGWIYSTLPSVRAPIFSENEPPR